MRVAECRCGQLKALCDGDPIRVSVCHCLACQRRTGSAFGVQARFSTASVTVEGETSCFVRVSDAGKRIAYRFCPRCGSTVAYQLEDLPEAIIIPVGAFADPVFERPGRSFYENRRHAWTAVLGDDVEHFD